MRGARVAVGVAVGVLLTACGADGAVTPMAQQIGAWTAVPDGPLSARENAFAIGIGDEVLVAGGSDAQPCPPNARCVVPDQPALVDGAIFNPQSGWRSIAPAPVPIAWADGVVIGSMVYMWVPGSDRPEDQKAFLAYDVARNRWRQLPLPPNARDDSCCAIAAAGERVVAYPGTDEWGELPDFAYDPARATWTGLPPDPLSPSFDRSMVFAGGELILFDHELVPQPGSDAPSVARAAALDLESGSWRRLPDSEIIARGPFVEAGGTLVNPMLGWADGGEIGNWGRPYPYGGVLDSTTGRWSGLPDPPDGQDEISAGVIGGDRAHYFGVSGWVLDTDFRTWTVLPSLDGVGQGAGTASVVSGRSVANVGRSLFAFGGVRWPDTLDEHEFLDDAWIWTPPEISSPG